MTSKQFKEWRLSQAAPKVRGKNHSGMSQAQVAKLLNRSTRTVQSWESGGRHVPKDIAQHIKGL